MGGVSVVICCYNAEARIVPTLEHLQKQIFNYHVDWEVIVVDNASTDGTSDMIKKIWNEKPITKLKIIQENKQGLIYARNRGILEASYELISFIDDDNWVINNWVQRVVEIFSNNKETGACGGKVIAVFEKEEPDWFNRFQENFAVGIQADRSGFVDYEKGFLWGAGLTIKKSVWSSLKAKGFEPLTTGRAGTEISSGDDTEICYAIRLVGYKLYYDEELVLKHFMTSNRMSISYLESITHSFGKAYARLNSYRVLLYPGNFHLHQWWYEWLVAVKNFYVLSVRILFSTKNSDTENLRIMRAYNSGYAWQVWKDKGLAKRNVKKLKKLIDN